MVEAGVDLSLSFESKGPTGQAVILLQPGGENSIVLVPAANADWWGSILAIVVNSM
jgi:sugar/nucleoside kinase (ribokinase family)